MIATTKPGQSPARDTVDPALGRPDPTAVEAAAAIARLFPEVYRRFHTGRMLAGGGSLPVTNRGLGVLRHLATAGPLTVGELAAHTGLRRNSTSELVARLAAKGLVDRIRDERDERRVLVWLTPGGQDVVARIGQVLAPDLLLAVMTGLEPDERALVVRGMQLLAAAAPVEAGLGVSASSATSAASTSSAASAPTPEHAPALVRAPPTRGRPPPEP